MTACAQAQADTWPTVLLPRGVNTFDIGRQVTMNGLPMQMRGFVSAIGARDIADAFRASLGKPLVESAIGSKLVLGRAQGDYYLSVQIEAAGAGSRGVVALTHLRAAHDNQAATLANNLRWLARLPAGSRLLSQMESQDAGKLSRHLVFTNSQVETLNRDRLIGLLSDEGLAIEREGEPEMQGSRPVPESIAGGRILFFKGSNKDAIATVRRDGAGQTIVVLNIVTSSEGAR